MNIGTFFAAFRAVCIIGPMSSSFPGKQVKMQTTVLANKAVNKDPFPFFFPNSNRFIGFYWYGFGTRIIVRKRRLLRSSSFGTMPSKPPSRLWFSASNASQHHAAIV